MEWISNEIQFDSTPRANLGARNDSTDSTKSSIRCLFLKTAQFTLRSKTTHPKCSVSFTVHTSNTTFDLVSWLNGDIRFNNFFLLNFIKQFLSNNILTQNLLWTSTTLEHVHKLRIEQTSRVWSGRQIWLDI